MSVSIGIGIEKGSNKSFLQRVERIAEGCGYGIDHGIASFEQDVRSGVEQICSALKWEHVCSIRAPRDAKANLAFGIHQELDQYMTTGEQPVFFSFCRELVGEARSTRIQKLGLFFATEWCASDRIRMGYGPIETLLSILSSPGHWTVMTLELSTGRMTQWDELPYYFEIEV